MGHQPAISFGHTGLPPLLKPRRHSHQTHFRETSFAHSTWLLDSALATTQAQPGEALLSDLPPKASNTQPVESKMESEVSAAAAKSTSDYPSFLVVFEDAGCQASSHPLSAQFPSPSGVSGGGPSIPVSPLQPRQKKTALRLKRAVDSPHPYLSMLNQLSFKTITFTTFSYHTHIYQPTSDQQPIFTVSVSSPSC